MVILDDDLGQGLGAPDNDALTPQTIADRSEFRGARFEEDKTDQKLLRGINQKLMCDGYINHLRVGSAPGP